MTREEKLQKILDLMGNTHTVQDIIAEIEAGTMQGFVEEDSWAVTQIHQFPRKRLLEIWMVVGELRNIDTLHARVVSYARETGCDLVRTFGRLGWKPTADRLGWKLKASAWVLEL
jgi:hypothetical protein